MGRNHLMDMKKAGMTPLAVADTDVKRLKVAQAEFPGIRTYTSLGAMLRRSDINLITIITPHNTHARLALQALRAGRSVCCEKPLAITTADCDRMIELAGKNKVLLSTYHNRHWDGCITQAVKTIESGAIGEIVRIEARIGCHGKPGNQWRSSKSISGGILYDWGVHLLEYSLQLIHSNIVEVGGFAKTGFWAPKTVWKGDTIEDEAFAVVRFTSGQWLTLTVSNIDSNSTEDQLEITGTKGTYVFGELNWRLIQPRGDKLVVTKGANPLNEWGRFYENISDHLVKGEKLIITPEWSRRPIHILDLACRSVAKGVSLKAKYS
ncbi:MAG: Gfo/Idh/MocA family oxidoreductase [Planctomycetes bacterium]|nr:Gfo/Idh/MocA family oxidoreductase [Planctomycetota bacterium]